MVNLNQFHGKSDSNSIQFRVNWSKILLNCCFLNARFFFGGAQPPISIFTNHRYLQPKRLLCKHRQNIDREATHFEINKEKKCDKSYKRTWIKLEGQFSHICVKLYVKSRNHWVTVISSDARELSRRSSLWLLVGKLIWRNIFNTKRNIDRGHLFYSFEMISRIFCWFAFEWKYQYHRFKATHTNSKKTQMLREINFDAKGPQI